MKLLAGLTLIFTIVYMFLNGDGPLKYNLSNIFFICGIIYFCIGLVTYVRNVGLFKLLAYHRYKKKQKNLIESGLIEDKSENIKELHEFADEQYSDKWKGNLFYKFAIPLLVLSLLLALI